MKKAVSIILCMMILCSLCAETLIFEVYADQSEEKVYCNATLDDDFADDSVLVVMKKSDSEKNLKRLPGYFDSGTVEEVVDLTHLNDEQAETALFNESEFNQIFLLKLKKPGKENVLKAIKKLEKKDYIQYVGPNYILTFNNAEDSSEAVLSEEDVCADFSTNDPRYSSQYALQKLEVENAWNISAGTDNVMVGVLDSGIDINHPELDGRVSSTVYANFTDEATAFDDLYGHGTHVAGIIGAEPNNGIGIAGVCRDTTLVSIKVLKKDADSGGAKGSTSWIIQGIQFAIENGIPILNCSLGNSSSGYSSALISALDNYTGLMICSAGNTGTNNDDDPRYPSSYTNENIISVGSTDDTDTKAPGSCYGKVSVDLFAPGVDIVSTLPGGTFGNKGGTSMAAPMVTGIAALIKSLRPEFSAAQIKQCILQGTDYIAGLTNYCVTRGRANAYNSLQIALNYTEGDYVVGTVNGDFNGDGADDVAMVSHRDNTGETIIKVIKSSAGSFQSPSVWWSSGTRMLDASVIEKRIVAGDFNGDGETDIAALLDLGDQNMNVIVWTSTGNSFNDYQIWSDHSDSHEYNVALVENRIVAGDFNGDGKDDIATMHDYLDQNMKIFVWKSTGTAFTMQSWYESLESKSYNASLINGRMVAGDFDGDGKDDIGAMHDYLDQNMKIFVWKSIGTAFTMQSWHESLGTKSYNAALISGRMVAGDFDGDGKDDIGAMHDYLDQNMKIFVWKSSGSTFSHFQTWADYSTSMCYNSNLVTNRFIAGDYNDDGLFDVAGLHDFSNHLRLFVWESAGSLFQSYAVRLTDVRAY